MTPRSVYDTISKYQGIKVVTICDVKAKCKQYHTCSNRSKSHVLDFDEAAHVYQKQKALPKTPKSVDAIAINTAEDLLILIEKKTWEYFLERLPSMDKIEQEEAALDKLSSYDLQEKYRSTREICEYITNEAGLFQSLPHVFVFLSELSDNDPMAGFVSMLSILAHTSSNIDYEIQYAIVNGMKQKLESVACQRSRYLNCMELDLFIDNPSAFK